MAVNTVILCGPASSDLFTTLTTPASLSLSIYRLVRSLSISHHLPPCTIQTLPPFYDIVSAAPYPSCVKAAVHWALDCSAPVQIDSSLVVAGAPAMSRKDWDKLAGEHGVVLSLKAGGEGRRLLFVPEEVGETHEKAFNLLELDRGEGRLGEAEVAVIVRRVQEETQKAVLETLAKELNR